MDVSPYCMGSGSSTTFMGLCPQEARHRTHARPQIRPNAFFIIYIVFQLLRSPGYRIQIYIIVFNYLTDGRKYPARWSERNAKYLQKVTMFVIQMKNALRGLSAPAAWQTPEKFFI
jgi:hypothetical protein